MIRRKWHGILEFCWWISSSMLAAFFFFLFVYLSIYFNLYPKQALRCGSNLKIVQLITRYVSLVMMKRLIYISNGIINRLCIFKFDIISSSHFIRTMINFIKQKQTKTPTERCDWLLNVTNPPWSLSKTELSLFHLLKIGHVSFLLFVQ